MIFFFSLLVVNQPDFLHGASREGSERETCTGIPGGKPEDWWLLRQQSLRCSSPRTRCSLTREISPNRKNKVPDSVPACFLLPSGDTGPFRLFVNKQERIKGPLAAAPVFSKATTARRHLNAWLTAYTKRAFTALGLAAPVLWSQQRKPVCKP